MSQPAAKFGFCAVLWAGTLVADAAATFPPEQVEFFERHIRPTLVNECYECHGAKKQEGGLRVDFRDGLRKGGDSGPALIAGDVKKSLLIQAIQHENPDTKMPKDRPKLAAPVIADFVTWVNSGAPDPRDEPPTETLASDQVWDAKVKASKNWWSFRQVKDPAVPEVKNTARSDHPVDRFILTKLE